MKYRVYPQRRRNEYGGAEKEKNWNDFFFHISFVLVLLVLGLQRNGVAEINEVMIAKKYHLLKTIWSMCMALPMVKSSESKKKRQQQQ